MAYSHFERLSALDDSFLELEDGVSHMHIGAVAIFDAAPLTTPEGGIDIARIEDAVAAGLYRIPRYRQKLARVPLFDHPVWVDDAKFNLHYHVRHTHLPAPGDERGLKRLAGRLMSQELDRGKPLWELWVVEGLEGGRFAIVTKVHHCMIDGVGSVELTGAMMRATPDDDLLLAEPPPVWSPRPAPSGAELFLSELAHRVGAPLAVARRAVSEPAALARGVIDGARGLAEVVATGLSPASPTPLNVDTGPHRRFDWLEMDLEEIRKIRKSLGGTINDVVLAITAGALRRFLHRRGDDVDGLDFRVMMPVNVRTADTRAQLGNKVAMLTARLPLDEPGARHRLERVIAETTRSKHSSQASGMQALEEISDGTFTTLLTQFARLTALSRPYNVIVTNVPGPPFPIWLLGAKMLSVAPLVPLFANQALGIALFSYDGRLFWGFNADWDALPDLHELVLAAGHELEALASAASVAGAVEATEGAVARSA